MLVGLFGCLDVVQYVSGTATEIDVYFRLTLQKSIFELANSMGDEPQDLNKMFEEQFNLEEGEVLDELPPGVEADFASLNTESEFGFVLTYTVPRALIDELSDDEAAFVPRVSPWGMFIPLSAGEGQDTDEFAQAFLGSAKYRLMISKRLVARVSAARVVSSERSVDVSVTDLPDVWLVEFPVSLWFGASGTPSLQILF